jgi:hypothetical protein
LKSLYRYFIYLFLIFFFSAGSALDAQSDSITSETADSEWPLEMVIPAGKIVMYQPQLESFSGNVLKARAAVSVTETDSAGPVFGAVWFSSHVSTDTDERTVTLDDVSITAAKFPDMKSEKIENLSRLLESELPENNIVMSLDEILASLELVEKQQNLSENINNKPPEIIFTTKPSVLVLIDGDPILQKIENTNLEYVVNTPFLIVYQPSSGQYFLRGGEHWYKSGSVLKNWAETTAVPEKIAALAKQEQTGTTGTAEEVTPTGETVIPEVIVRTKPAELIQSNGDPKYAPIEGTGLLYIKNTESDVILDIQTQEYFILVSGRWYKSGSMTGDSWTFVAPDGLPEDFTRIPADSEMGKVLSNVAGTQEAQDAVLENSIPQTAVIDRSEAKLNVQYDGDPEFKKIEGTAMFYADNADKPVLLIDGRYYCCDDAVWFESNYPDGPWQVSTKVPDQVQEIPPECPLYNVKYVYIYDYTPDLVYVGYTPGYCGSYVYDGCIVYGTGWWYHPWYRRHYYPRPVTWGYGICYNSWTGWGFSFGVSYGWLNIGFGTWRKPYYGYWGPAHYRAGYRHGYYAGVRSGYRTIQYSSNRNIYRRRDIGVRQTTTARSQTASARTVNRSAKNQLNNVYTNPRGEVFRRDASGKWQKRENGKWQKTDQTGQNGSAKTGESPRKSGAKVAEQASHPQAKSGSGKSKAQSGGTGSHSLNRDFQSRQRGSERTKQFKATRNSRDGSRAGRKKR